MRAITLLSICSVGLVGLLGLAGALVHPTSPDAPGAAPPADAVDDRPAPVAPRRSLLAAAVRSPRVGDDAPETGFDPELHPDEVVAAAFDGRYAALTQQLRADPSRSVRVLHAELRAADEAALRTPRARVLIHALGEVAAPESAAVLAELVDRPLPPVDPTAHHHEPRAEGTITRALALEALAKLARCSADDAAMQALEETLRRVIDDRPSHHLVAEAVTQLRLRDDSDRTRAELEARLGPELAHFAHLELRTTLPPTAEGD